MFSSLSKEQNHFFMLLSVCAFVAGMKDLREIDVKNRAVFSM